MKSFILVTGLLFLSTFSFSQIFVGNVNINSEDSIKIIEVYVDRRAVRNIVHVGQRDNFNEPSPENRNDVLEITDPKTQRELVFKSTAAVLNFFEHSNWEYINGFTENTRDAARYYYYFRKRQSK